MREKPTSGLRGSVAATKSLKSAWTDCTSVKANLTSASTDVTSVKANITSVLTDFKDFECGLRSTGPAETGANTRNQLRPPSFS